MPSAREISDRLALPIEDVVGALHELDGSDVIALHPGTDSVWLAHPFSSADEPFKVQTDRGEWDAICVWDALGVLAITEQDGEVTTACPDCGESLTLTVRAADVLPSDHVVHFGVPANRWYEDLAHT